MTRIERELLIGEDVLVAVAKAELNHTEKTDEAVKLFDRYILNGTEYKFHGFEGYTPDLPFAMPVYDNDMIEGKYRDCLAERYKCKICKARKICKECDDGCINNWTWLQFDFHDVSQDIITY